MSLYDCRDTPCCTTGGCEFNKCTIVYIRYGLTVCDKHLADNLNKASNFKGQVVYTYVQVRIGGYRLPTDLGIGQFRELKVHEVRRVLDKGAQANPYL